MTLVKTYGERLKAAREHAKLSQVDLAAAAEIKQQTVQYLEDPKRAAKGSKHTAAFARACGVDVDWLQTGRGSMLPTLAREPSAQHAGGGAQEVLAAWAKLSPESQQWLRELIFMVATIETKYPWMRRGRPSSESYAAYERRVEQSMAAQVVLNTRRVRKS